MTRSCRHEGARVAGGEVVDFEFRFTDAYRLAARPFGIGPDNALVQVSERTLRATYGRWLVETPLANIVSVEITGPYRFVKTAGPPRLGITDRGLTFASNGDLGLCITFRERVWGFDRLGLIRHPNLTVTVADVERLAWLLSGRADFAGSVQALGL
ncbi:MAG TPA: hypothetical protein VE992_02705 [Solirubrobacteraceae bacterium]|nr:hypothetical protein [Solirubrobacteraceae bacterium]